MESVGITFEKAKEFIEMYGFENEIDEIILAYVEQPKWRFLSLFLIHNLNMYFSFRY